MRSSTTNKTSLGLALVALFAMALAAGPQAKPSAPDEVPTLPPLPTTPASISEIIAARPFVVLEPWASDWCAEHTQVERGWVVILRAPHDFVVPRQTAEPILYAGARTAERIINAPETNLILAIVPATRRDEAVPGHAAGAGGTAPVGAEAQPSRPFADLAIWFGSPGLPEQVDLATIEHEIELANAASIAPRALEEFVRALKRGGAAIAVADRAALLAAIEPWAAQHGMAPIEAPGATPAGQPGAALSR